MKNINIDQKAIVYKSKTTGKYSIRMEGDLFWTGLKSDSWIPEGKDQNEIWKSINRDLVYAFCTLVEYVLINDKTVQGILEEVS